MRRLLLFMSLTVATMVLASCAANDSPSAGVEVRNDPCGGDDLGFAAAMNLPAAVLSYRQEYGEWPQNDEDLARAHPVEAMQFDPTRYHEFALHPLGDGDVQMAFKMTGRLLGFPSRSSWTITLPKSTIDQATTRPATTRPATTRSS
jgi:hypothetical protein